MNINGDFFSVKKSEYNDRQLECIFDCVNKLEEIDEKPLMMLGKIQSGKTKAFIGVISLAFDNGYDLAVVLTKNSNALAKQTTARMQQEFKDFRDDDMLNIFDIMCVPSSLTRYELDQKMIIVVKKQHKNLPRLMAFIEQYALSENKKCLIIDDEADFSSIGFEKDSETEAFDLKKIASQINDLRLKLTCRFIQVTATPYSLYLQPEEIDLNNDKVIKPIKPAHTVIVPSGEGYIGGEYYFSVEKDSLSEYLFCNIDPKELEIIKSSDRRRFKEEDILMSNKVLGLRTAIINFITGGCIRILQNGGTARGKKNKYSFIFHTEIQKASHARQENLISDLMVKLEEEVKNNTLYINNLIKESYENLIQSVERYEFQIPEVVQVIDLFKKSVKEEWITKIVVNSENDIDTLLDNDGQLKLRTPLNIFVGGQILDRGITISNLIGFYYGRRPNKMQQDTVLQHSRMFGYRSEKDLAVTRFYTTLDLYERMRKINEFDTKLREDFEDGKVADGVIFISQDNNGKIIPCSPNKILLSKTHVVKPGQRILPVGFTTLCKTKIIKYNNNIEKILRGNNDDNLIGEFSITKLEAIEIIENIYETLVIENELTVDKDAFISIIKYLSTEKVSIVARTNRNISKHRKGRFYSDVPDNLDDRKPARDLAINEPSLILLKQNGNKEEFGWNDAEFWWPIIIVQENMNTAVYSNDLKI